MSRFTRGAAAPLRRAAPALAALIAWTSAAAATSSTPATDPAVATTGSAGAGAPVRASTSKWSQVTTPDFTILGEVPEARLRTIGARLEAFRATLEYLHPGSGASPRETFVYVFARTETGQAYTPERLSASGHLGVNAPYDVGNYVVIVAPDDDPPLEPLYHAYTHQFLDDGFPRLPLFVEEGLAEVYTRFRLVPDGALIGLVAQERLDWIRAHGTRPLVEEFDLDAKALRGFTPEAQKSFVADSWVLMHWMLTASGDKRAGVPGFLDALQRGGDAGEAARANLGTDLDGLREAMTQYARGSRFLPLRAAGPSVRQDPAAYAGRPMPRDEVLAALGDLIAHAGPAHDADAETYFAEAIRFDPQQARAYAALGALRCSRDRLDDAVIAFEKAIAIEPDAMSCYLLARTLLKIHAKEEATAATPPWLARARALLGQASTLRPGFAAPYVLLGTTHIRPDGDALAGIDALQKARALLPARTDIAGNLVYLYLRAGDLARAKATLNRVLVPSGDTVTAERALKAIQTYEVNAERRQGLAQYRAAEEKQKAEHPVDPAAYARFIQDLREALSKVTDPKRRQAILDEIAAYEHPSDIDSIRATEIYNDAIEHANKRDYAGAIGMLEDLLKHDINADLRYQVNATLERLRQDAARQQQPPP